MRDFSVLSRRDVLRMAGAVGGLAVTGVPELWAQSARKIESLAPELDRVIGTSEPIRELATGYGGDHRSRRRAGVVGGRPLSPLQRH